MVAQLGCRDRFLLFLDRIPLEYQRLLESGNPQHQCKAILRQSYASQQNSTSYKLNGPIRQRSNMRIARYGISQQQEQPCASFCYLYGGQWPLRWSFQNVPSAEAAGRL